MAQSDHIFILLSLVSLDMYASQAFADFFLFDNALILGTVSVKKTT